MKNYIENKWLKIYYSNMGRDDFRRLKDPDSRDPTRQSLMTNSLPTNREENEPILLPLGDCVAI